MELSKVSAVPFMQISAIVKDSEADELLIGRLVSIWLSDNKMGEKTGREKWSWFLKKIILFIYLFI